MPSEQRDQTTATSPLARAAWLAGGVVLVVLGVVLIRLTQIYVADMSQDIRFMATLGMRGATFVLIGGGAWCLVRGWKRT
ncbi:hypothetical protein ABT084_04075 [Streptomyces sp. NPDC002138]|uniref:hypothetical protein n=1 Tax=Streptomyces sp. NPDC002138 TaxID=3154410 RepID=UPI0033321E5B